jgi:hypothetical protein
MFRRWFPGEGEEADDGIDFSDVSMHLRQLYPPENQTPLVFGVEYVGWLDALKDHISNERISIVLVPGLGGHVEKTWQSRNDETLWPRDLLPSQIPDARVLGFNYNTTLKRSAGNLGIRDHARGLQMRLSEDREDEVDKSRPLVFVGHSLGGLIIKQVRRIRAAAGQALTTPLR